MSTKDNEFLNKRIIHDYILYLYFAVITKSGSESSISETCDSSKTEPTVDKGAPESTDDTRSIAVTKEALDIPITNMGKRGSLTSAKSLHELKHEVANESSKKDDPDDAPKTESKGIRPSKSDTSLTESFVIIDNENKRKHCPNALREGKCLIAEYLIFIGSQMCLFSLQVSSGNVNWSSVPSSPCIPHTIAKTMPSRPVSQHWPSQRIIKRCMSAMHVVVYFRGASLNNLIVAWPIIG